MTKQELELKKKELQAQLQVIGRKLYSFEYEEKKAQYGDKFNCLYCKFSAVGDLSGDGWHNTCGANNCTCCHSVCEKYEPDNDVTLFVKKNAKYGHIDEDQHRAIRNLVGNIFAPCGRSEKIIALLKTLWDIKESEGEG